MKPEDFVTLIDEAVARGSDRTELEKAVADMCAAWNSLGEAIDARS